MVIVRCCQLTIYVPLFIAGHIRGFLHVFTCLMCLIKAGELPHKCSCQLDDGVVCLCVCVCVNLACVVSGSWPAHLLCVCVCVCVCGICPTRSQLPVLVHHFPYILAIARTFC